MAFKCPHKKNGFSAQNGPFACLFCGGTGHKYAKCWEREENAHLRPKGWMSKSAKNVEILQCDMIFGKLECFEIKLLEQM